MGEKGGFRSLFRVYKLLRDIMVLVRVGGDRGVLSGISSAREEEEG